MLKLILVTAGSFAQPVISSFSPQKGNIGASVVISGSNFNTTSDNNVVFFGTTRATISSASATSLTVSVPSGAAYAPIQVVNKETGLSAFSATPFSPGFVSGVSTFSSDDFGGLVRKTIPESNQYQYVAMGDLDGDGKSDLMSVVWRNPGVLSVFRNTSSSGTISLASYQNFETLSWSRSISVKDMDGDGKLDVVIGYLGDKFSIFRNTSTSGSISFATRVDISIQESSWFSMAVGDLDLDGKPDLAFASDKGYVNVMRNTSSGSSFSFAAKLNYAAGSSGDVHQSITIGDLNNDGKPELVSTNRVDDKVYVYKNTCTPGTISFDSKIDIIAQTDPKYTTIGDLDGDGLSELIVANNGSNSVSVFRNTTSGGSISFDTKQDFSTGTQPYSVKLCDITGDGNPDVISCNEGAGTVSMLENKTSGSTINFATKVSFSTNGSQPFIAAYGDLDGDNRPDMAAANTNGGDLTVTRNLIGTKVTPTFTQVGPYCTGASISALPTTSLEGITGTWSPAISNTQTKVYTFTPTAGQYAFTTTMTISIGNSWSGGSSNWNNSANWSCGSVPAGASNIIITTGTPTMDVDLTLAVGATLTLSGSGSLVISAGKTLTIAGTADFGGKSVTLKSTSNGTASIGQITGTLSNATNVTVERYIPATGRRYRLLTPSVTTTGSIRDNWMEGGMNTVIGTNNNPNPGYGTQITGLAGNTNGFDVSGSNDASLYATTNGTTLSYAAITNTSATLNALTGYFVFVRGDRTQNMTLANTNVAPNPVQLPTSATTLRATGTLLQGTQTSFTNALNSTAGALNLVTNPYASPIDWSLVQAASSNIGNAYTFWDPNIGFRGGFVTVTTGGVVTPSTSGSSAASKTIQAGQAFFVTATGAGTAAVSIQEGHKTRTGQTNAVFSTGAVLAPVASSLSLDLYYKEANGNLRLADGVKALFADGYSKTLDANDAVEIPNWDENLALQSNGLKLAIESRPNTLLVDTLTLSVSNLKKMNYELQLTGGNFSNPLLQASLLDRYTQMTTPVSLTGTTVVPFTVTTDPASSTTNRFVVVFSTAAALPITFKTFTGQASEATTQLVWEVASEDNIVRYEIEKSDDGEQFSAIGRVAPKPLSTTGNRYVWSDASRAGQTYYRIKSIASDGKVMYSKIVKMSLGRTTAGVQAYPNPLRGKSFTLQFNQMPAGKYSLSWYNSNGHLLNESEWQHSGSFFLYHPAVPAMNGNLQWKLTGGQKQWNGVLVQ